MSKRVDVPGFEERRTELEGRWSPWVPRTLGDLLAAAAAKWGDAPYLISEGRSWSYREVDAEVDRLAVSLRGTGVTAGDRVGILIGNTADMYLCKFAVARLGGIDIPMNYLMSPRELAFVIRQSGMRTIVARATIVGRDMCALIDGARELTSGQFPQLVDVLIEPGRVTAETIGRAPRRAADGEAEHQPAAFDAVAEIIYTSGSTGRPKGAMLSHDGLLRNAYGTAYARALPRGNRAILSLPPFHRFGWGESVLPALFVGGAVILEESFDPKVFLARIEEYQATDMVCVARMVQVMMESPTLATTDLSSLRSVLSGGDVVPESYWLSMSDRFGIDEITTAYGMTEHGISFLARPDDPLEQVVNTVGRPKVGGVAGMAQYGRIQSQWRVIDPVTGVEVGPGVEGELCFKGPSVTLGYWDDVESNSRELIDGWHRSGDLGRIREDGCLVFTGRVKEMFRSGGENVVPREVESVVDRVDGVVMSYVVGVPDPTWGEVGCACVLLEPGAEVTEEQILEHCRKELARYKVPKHIIVLTPNDLPTTATGKIKKIGLVPLAVERLGLASRAGNL